MKFKFLFQLILLLSISGLISCVTVDQTKPINHSLIISVDKSIEKITDVNYKYGTVQARNRKFFFGSNPTSLYFMTVPEFFEIEWKTQDGVKHEAKIPVRGRVPGRIERNTILFIIYYDYVEAYKESYTPHGIYRDKFLD